jgi:hypothetical protein
MVGSNVDAQTIQAMTDAQLMEALAANVEQQKELERQEEPLRAEQLRRQRETGEMNVKHNGWESRLKRESFSEAWLKRETGYTKEDLPQNCFTEKMSIVVDWERVNQWMQEHHGHALPVTYSLSFQREKAKAV